MIFRNRQEAGQQLAKRLQYWADREDAVVLAVPRGGIEVAFSIARSLHLPLDILLAGKLGIPGQKELAFGAVAPGGFRYLDQRLVDASGLTHEQVEGLIDEKLESLRRQDRLYRANRGPLDVAGRTAILVDDGVATGASILVALRALRAMNPARLILALPLAPQSACERLRSEADEVICLHEPAKFYAVGEFYRDFPPVSDNEVVELLERAEQQRRSHETAQPWRSSAPGIRREEFLGDVTMQVGRIRLEGTLMLPVHAQGLIVFAHGSGSSRFSPRNGYVAKMLQSRQLGTLLFDLLTPEEEAAEQWGERRRFDIPLLAERLVVVTLWLEQQRAFRDLPLGYFGASTGAAAALVAAARIPNKIHAVVARGGRPDLAADSLGKVFAPTLLLVGGRDEAIIAPNQKALAALGCAEKSLIVIPGATHLFEEPGSLEQVSQHAAEWFRRYLVGASQAASIAPAGNLQAD